MMTDDEIIAIAKATETAEPGTDGYILPVSFARAIENAVIVKLAVSQNALKDEIRLIWKPKCDALRQQLEAAQAEVKHLNLHLKATQSGRDAALARLAEIENQEPAYLLTPDGKCYAYGSAQPLSAGHADATLLELYAAAGASPVEPSQAQPPAPSDTAITYMTGYSDGREWAKPSQALELSDDEIDALLPTITLKGLDPKQQVWLTKKDAIAFARAIIAAIKQGGQHD